MVKGLKKENAFIGIIVICFLASLALFLFSLL